MNELRAIERSLMKRQQILSKKIDDENTVFENNSTTNERGKQIFSKFYDCLHHTHTLVYDTVMIITKYQIE